MRLKIVLSLVLLIVIGSGAWVLLKPSAKSSQQLLKEAQSAMRLHRYGEAEKIITQAIDADPASSAALLVAGEIQMRKKDWDSALGYLQKVSVKNPSDYSTARFSMGEIHRGNGALSRAEESYQQALDVTPEMANAHARLALIKRLTGRERAAEAHLKQLLQQQQISPEELAWLAAPNQNVNAEEYLKTCQNSAPQDPLPIFGLGNIALNQGRLNEAEKLFLKGLTLRPDPEIVADLGLCLIEQDKTDNIEAWVSELTTSQRAHPEVQYVLGLIDERERRVNAALSHFARCLDQLPFHQGALNHLATLLNRTGEAQLSASVLEVVQRVSTLGGIMSGIQSQRPTQQAAQQVSQLLAKLGRSDEAIVWAVIAGAGVPETSSADSQLLETVQQQVDLLAVRSTADLDIAMSQKPDQLREGNAAGFQFVNQATDLGINFQYYESPDPETEGRRMFEFTGGGVGVIDYDLDGWVDLYFTQGTTWPPDVKNSHYRDALYRQVDHTFVRVDERAGIDELGFSQGVSVGDLNNDGFPDIYVANFGSNAGFMNNGDGTYTKLECAALSAEQEWTTSCLIADLNDDQYPDLFDVNYLRGEGLSETICDTPSGSRVCTPLAFQSAVNRFLLGVNNGDYLEATQAYGLDKPGNGLGIVAVDLDEEPGLELFIANDLMANFLWKREGAAFIDKALLQGWAFGSDGKVQACMGVAAGDLNGDCKTDLYVTNYSNEPNALYILEDLGLTQDRSSEFGLRSPSLPMLGFGTQALDADLDGDLDLVIANGDLDDFTHQNRQFNMPPQLMENRSNQQFLEVKTFKAESYFNGAYRGRGLGKLDWNRDGLCDFAVSHLDTTSALVTNKTTPISDWISIRLIGTQSARDALGAKVSLSSKGGKWQQQLTAGDGYCSSNERQLLFAVPDLNDFELQIEWPTGRVETWSQLSSNHRWLAVEGNGIYQAAP